MYVLSISSKQHTELPRTPFPTHPISPYHLHDMLYPVSLAINNPVSHLPHLTRPLPLHSSHSHSLRTLHLSQCHTYRDWQRFAHPKTYIHTDKPTCTHTVCGPSVHWSHQLGVWTLRDAVNPSRFHWANTAPLAYTRAARIRATTESSSGRVDKQSGQPLLMLLLDTSCLLLAAHPTVALVSPPFVSLSRSTASSPPLSTPCFL
jgi:hypothetical protein